jgi:hypothetical protein
MPRLFLPHAPRANIFLQSHRVAQRTLAGAGCIAVMVIVLFVALNPTAHSHQLFLLANTYLRWGTCRYIVVMVIVLFAALEAVTILNAIYLLLITIFLVFPQLIETFWVSLVL